MVNEPRSGTTRARVLEFVKVEGGDQSMNAIVLGVDGSAAAIRHAVESLLRSGHLKERKEKGSGVTYTRRISINEEYKPEAA